MLDNREQKNFTISMSENSAAIGYNAGNLAAQLSLDGYNIALTLFGFGFAIYSVADTGVRIKTGEGISERIYRGLFKRKSPTPSY